jgi:uncharacterized hydrophobic protein (TIGR00271 family)
MRLRVLCPAESDGTPELAQAVLGVLADEPGVAHVVWLRGAAIHPAGDVVEADLAREAVDDVLETLRGMDCARRGGIVLEELDTVLSAAADRAEADAPGEGIDAVVWDELLAQTGQSARLSVTFVVMLTIACLLAGVGVVTNSAVTVVGAMVLGPEFGPLAALSVAAVRGDARLARTAGLALAVGFAIAVVVTALASAAAHAAGLIPDDALTDLSGVSFIYQVGPFSLVIALLAGVAGMVALVAGESAGVLVGVFISITTVPAAGFAAVAAVVGSYTEAGSSLAQLAINIVGVVVAGIAVLLLVRASRRWRRVDGRRDDALPAARTGG